MRETCSRPRRRSSRTALAELKEMEARIASGAQKKDEADAARFKGLVTMYETMKPKDAAKIFDRLDMKILIEVASQINPRRMSEIMAQMTPEAAEKLTVELANRAAPTIGPRPAPICRRSRASRPAAERQLSARLTRSLNALGLGSRASLSACAYVEFSDPIASHCRVCPHARSGARRRCCAPSRCWPFCRAPAAARTGRGARQSRRGDAAARPAATAGSSFKFSRDDRSAGPPSAATCC